jgi:hypothetical protein
VINAILVFTTIGPTKRVMVEQLKNVQGGDTAATIAGAGIAGGAVVALLFSIGFAILAIYVGRGKNPARIVTWVLTGLSVCCGGIGLVTSATGTSFGGGSSANGAPSQAEIQRAINEALPSWYHGVTLTLGVIGLLIALAVLILLMLPASNEFFRKRPVQEWEPPVPPVGPGPSAAPGAWPPPAGPPPAGPPPAGPPPA